MSAQEAKKATAATSETIAEPKATESDRPTEGVPAEPTPSPEPQPVFHEAMRSYEKALTAGIQLQEESVNLWKDLLSKLGCPEEFQAKLESMRADVLVCL